MPGRPFWIATRFGLLVSAIGCTSQPPRVHQVDVDPQIVAQELIALGDLDKDQLLTSGELKRLPYLSAMMRNYDINADGQLSEDELVERLASDVFDPRKALTPGECIVQRDGKPFRGAQVRLIPAPCLEAYLPTASGIADRNGLARLSMDPQNWPENAPRVAGLIRPGLYLIEVTHTSIEVPRRYNAETILGAEASNVAQMKGPIVVDIQF